MPECPFLKEGKVSKSVVKKTFILLSRRDRAEYHVSAPSAPSARKSPDTPEPGKPIAYVRAKVQPPCLSRFPDTIRRPQPFCHAWR